MNVAVHGWAWWRGLSPETRGLYVAVYRIARGDEWDEEIRQRLPALDVANFMVFLAGQWTLTVEGDKAATAVRRLSDRISRARRCLLAGGGRLA